MLAYPHRLTRLRERPRYGDNHRGERPLSVSCVTGVLGSARVRRSCGTAGFHRISVSYPLVGYLMVLGGTLDKLTLPWRHRPRPGRRLRPCALDTVPRRQSDPPPTPSPQLSTYFPSTADQPLHVPAHRHHDQICREAEPVKARPGCWQSNRTMTHQLSLPGAGYPSTQQHHHPITPNNLTVPSACRFAMTKVRHRPHRQRNVPQTSGQQNRICATSPPSSAVPAS